MTSGESASDSREVESALKNNVVSEVCRI